MTPDHLRWFVPIERVRALLKDLPGDWLVSPDAEGDLRLAVLDRDGFRHLGTIDIHENVVRYAPQGGDAPLRDINKDQT